MSARVIGIDLGTSNSVVGAVINGRPIVIPDAHGRTVMPSMVSFLPDGHVVVGHRAYVRSVVDPINTIYSAKRLIGRPFYAPEVGDFMAHYPFDIRRGEDDNPKIHAYGRQYAIEEVQAIILRRMKTTAEAYLGESVGDAVVTVPANFNESQRYATKVAGELAGLNVLRIINEPTAAALAYGYGHGRQERIAIYDFGGGTFDITMLELRSQVFEVMSTAGNTYLGGNDFDERIVASILESFRAEHGIDLSVDLSVRQRLKSAAEQLKCELSDRESVSLELKERVPGSTEEIAIQFSMDRAEFDLRCRDIVQMTFAVCDEALNLAGVGASQIEHVVLVGGTTRIPLVREMVESYFLRTTEHEIDAHEVVAVGAAIFANSLTQGYYTPSGSHQAAGALLIDVTSHSLGVETLGNLMDTVIERNTSIPAQRTRTFTTSADDQHTVRIQVFEGEERTTLKNSKLGELTLSGLRGSKRGELKIDVTFQINTDGMLEVTALDRDTKIAQTCTLSIAGGLSEKEVDRLKSTSTVNFM